MSFFKKQKPQPKVITVPAGMTVSQFPTVKCSECKHIIEKRDAQEVRNISYNDIYFYCPMHWRPYEAVQYFHERNKTVWYGMKRVPEHYEKVGSKLVGEPYI